VIQNSKFIPDAKEGLLLFPKTLIDMLREASTAAQPTTNKMSISIEKDGKNEINETVHD